MVGLIYAMFAIILIVIIFFIVILAKQAKHKETKTTAGADKYDVFAVSGNQLIVLTGLPVTYEIDEIDKITFSVMVGGRSAYNGVMRIVKTNGKKSRPFLFDGSAYKRKTVLKSSRQDIEQSTQYLMNELKQYNISCSRAQ